MGYPKRAGRSSLGMIFNVDSHGDLRSCSKRRRYTAMTQTTRSKWHPPVHASCAPNAHSARASQLPRPMTGQVLSLAIACS